MAMRIVKLILCLKNGYEDIESESKIWQYLRISGIKIKIQVGRIVTALQILYKMLTEDFWRIVLIPR